MMDDTAAGLVTAMATKELGRAVSKTLRTYDWLTGAVALAKTVVVAFISSCLLAGW